MKYRLVLSTLLTVAFLTMTTELHADNMSDLRVSKNGHFLVHRDGRGFFPVADTIWAIAWRLTREQVDAYLQHRKDQQFNTIALVAFPSYEGGKIIPNAYGDYAFEVGQHGAWDPRRPITAPGDNPENATEYDYWDHLEYIIDAAESMGMYAVLLPAWGGCVAGDWGNGHATAEIIFDVPGAYAYGRWIGRRFNDKKNLLWMMGGDRSAIYGERDYRQVFRAMAEGVADGVNGVDQQDGKADYGTTLMSYHPRKWMPNSSEWFHDDPWLDFNSIQDQPLDQIAAVTLDYGLSPAKPTWLFEGGYEYRGAGKGQYRDWQIRFQSYQTVFAGGFGVTYGSMNIYHCGGGNASQVESIAIGETSPWEASLDEAGALDMQHLYRLMCSLSNEQFLDRIPDQELIDGDTGGMEGNEGVISHCIQATRGARGDYAMIYSADGRNIRLHMDRLAAPRMNAFWFNPRNGKWRTGDQESADQIAFKKDIPSGPGAALQEFDPPGNVGDGNDWVLVLKVAQ